MYIDSFNMHFYICHQSFIHMKTVFFIPYRVTARYGKSDKKWNACFVTLYYNVQLQFYSVLKLYYMINICVKYYTNQLLTGLITTLFAVIKPYPLCCVFHYLCVCMNSHPINYCIQPFFIPPFLPMCTQPFYFF